MEKTKVRIVDGQDWFNGFLVYGIEDESLDDILDKYPYDNSLDIGEIEDQAISWILEDYEVVEMWNDAGLFRFDSSGNLILED